MSDGSAANRLFSKLGDKGKMNGRKAKNQDLAKQLGMSKAKRHLTKKGRQKIPLPAFILKLFAYLKIRASHRNWITILLFSTRLSLSLLLCFAPGHSLQSARLQVQYVPLIVRAVRVGCPETLKPAFVLALLFGEPE
jgi:hypothetical protein